jgi:stearoyl-CoA desaturase (delta-9 desaturase)
VNGQVAFVVVPFAGLAEAVWLAWGHGLNLADVLLALAFYVITGLGVTVGFHRLLTHCSFTAVPALRVVLQVDISAAVIRIFARLGWATKVRWPTPARLDSRRRYCPAWGEPEPVLRPGGRRTGRTAASRLSPLPARGDRVR